MSVVQGVFLRLPVIIPRVQSNSKMGQEQTGNEISTTVQASSRTQRGDGKETTSQTRLHLD